MILHRLYELGTNGNSSLIGSSLADSCWKHLGIEVSKDDLDEFGKKLRTNFGQWKHAPQKIPQQYIDYLVGDITATWELYLRFKELYKKLYRDILSQHPFGFVGEKQLRNMWEKHGPLTHNIQLKAAIVLDETTRNGLCVDSAFLNKFREELLSEQKSLEQELLQHGYRSGKGSKKALQRILSLEEKRHNIRFERTETGQISTSKANLDLYESTVPFIRVFLDFKRIEKLLGSFLNKMEKGILHPEFDFLKSTGRTSAFGDISSQNLPRDERVRKCFVPSPGYIYFNGDYSAIELAALAQSTLSQFGGESAMADAINQGRDLHKLIAAKVTGKPESGITKDERQKAKAVNFGLPGGMGDTALQNYAKMNYGAELSEAEAKQLRDTWFTIFPEMRSFLQGNQGQCEENLGKKLAYLLNLTASSFAQATGWDYQKIKVDALGWMARNVISFSEPCYRSGSPYDENVIDYFWEKVGEILPQLSKKYQKAIEEREASKELANAVCRLAQNESALTLTGRLRANVTFCAQHNTIFQGLAADGAKLAMWKLFRAGHRIVNFIHDEFLIEIPQQEDTTEIEKDIKRLMIEGMQEVLPDIRIDVEYSVKPRWEKG